MTRVRADRGAAAVELALLVPVLLALFAFVAPMGYLMFERVQLGRTAGDAIRFATSRPDAARSTGSTAVAAGALPSAGAVAEEAVRAHRGQRPVTTSMTRATDGSCPSRFRRTVTVTTTVDLGPFLGSVLSDTTKTLTATATSCEE